MKNNLESVNCNICNENNFEKISEKGQFDIPLSVVLCKNCGLGYLNPRWNAEGYLAFYRDEYDKYYRPELIKSKDVEGFKENPILKRLAERNLLNFEIDAVLDIGSGAGANLLDIGKKFPSAKLAAIEPSPDSQTILKKNKVNVISGDVNSDWDSDLPQKYDLVIMRHVLEHFLDPLAILNRVKNVLTEHGIVYIAVPNNLNPTQSLTKSWFRVVHTYYFNKYSLDNILKLAGLEKIEIVEGDQFNSAEVFLMAKKAPELLQCTFDKNHFEVQKNVFEMVSKAQKNPIYIFKSKLIKVKKKLFSS